MEESVDRIGQDVPAAAQKRREKAIETEDLDQRRKKNIKECVFSLRLQPDLVAQGVVIGYSLDIG